MTALDQLFSELRNQNRKALMPFFTAGDPDIATTAAVVQAAREHGADLCEIGIPYSDPIADGPVIQASYQRALDSGFRLQQAFDLGEQLQANQTVAPMPRVTMVSYAIIFRIGSDEYIRRAKQAGFCGAIVPDLLVEEAESFSQLCRDADFSLIQLVTPTTSRERQIRIAELSTGFLYYVSVTGITGERTELPANLVENVTWLREQTDLPICIGFGISSPETAAKLAPVADGLIVGSAIVRRVHEAVADRSGDDAMSAAVEKVGEFCRSLRQAIDQA